MQVDWDNWQPTMRATLLFLLRGEEVLLIRKKRGLGAGKVNGPGGKIDPGETAAQAAVREVLEEVCIEVSDPVERGVLRFQFVDGEQLAVHLLSVRIMLLIVTDSSEPQHRIDDVGVVGAGGALLHIQKLAE